ncbi:hypothetical protein GOODEAATRI_029284 [Goodea atripinnis]|uniref:Uncharacterized protein n=1 Tax=Goodea atripinnis TaxID=208336 RepID=A0ABV0MW59_9TELE
MMKMALVSVVILFLICSSTIASQVCDQFAATGRNVNVPLGYELKPTDALKWKFKDKIIFHKRQENVLVKNSDVKADGSLELTNLKKDQEGVYIPEVYDQSGKSQTTKSTNLCIMGRYKMSFSFTCVSL